MNLVIAFASLAVICQVEKTKKLEKESNERWWAS